MNLTDKQKEQFNKYYEMLTDWNENINLTAITDKDEVWLKHFEDSLSIVKIKDMDHTESVIDVGTGAGFPGLPIKIAYPHIKLTLLDSLDKRIRFLEAVVRELGLTDVTCIHGRAEDFSRSPEYREKYDLCVSRAVAGLSVLSELCIPFVKPGGSFVAYKSEKAEAEIAEAENALAILNGRIKTTEEFTLSDNVQKRVLIDIEKTGLTPEKYPRRAGVPAKKPL
jgi:16S rRNA (guanine527-N7)-methyltransferase